MEYLASNRIRSLDRPAFAESVYRLVKVKVSLFTSRNQIVAVEVRLQFSLTSALDGSGEIQALAAFASRKWTIR